MLTVITNNPNALHGWSPQEERDRRLIEAGKRGVVEDVLALLAAGAVLEATDVKEWTGLHWAAARGHVGGVRCLLEAGADVDRPALGGSQRACGGSALPAGGRGRRGLRDQPPGHAPAPFCGSRSRASGAAAGRVLCCPQRCGSVAEDAAALGGGERPRRGGGGAAGGRRR
ncbi:serine/threonine-protein phosphatase 6 regulatory ankyrin repeat subunit C-like [Schistocerca piceifrons]|uniref:serine/threonine-protein phosphatase 6 regulatory ankyrin repeat subunit C-like n=1 Tax=Schistocerca piceifrons TaxID=274613 RepID=UPI001F5F2AA2|nr:serine/threonine-protein phosphatase 6 regulatory ankyrin repeat subunit C-like [Schistocerca piceifrons]